MAQPSDRGDGGIFIPYDRLLQQQSDKLDKILEELREFDRRKLDINVFESFRSSYEQRHDALKTMVQDVASTAKTHDSLIPEFRKSQNDIEALYKDKAERDAVKAQTRYYLAGGGLVGFLVVVNLAINFLQLAGHS